MGQVLQMHTRCARVLGDVGKLCLQEEAKAKFNESVEIAINLGVDPRRGDQQVRGAVVLPHGTGRDMRVAVFAEDEAAELARSAGEAPLILWSCCSLAMRLGDERSLQRLWRLDLP